MLDIVRSPRVDYERDLQFRLNRLNNLRFNPSLPSPHWKEELSEVARLTVVEGKFLEGSRQGDCGESRRSSDGSGEFHQMVRATEARWSGTKRSPVSLACRRMLDGPDEMVLDAGGRRRSWV